MKTTLKFHIGLTMAGAVSAGAYTAGVVDYLLETLQRWEMAKQGDDPSVPTHEVILEVMSGASAGGITAALAGLSLFDKHAHFDKNEKSKLFKSWVIAADEPQSTTLEKMLSTKTPAAYKAKNKTDEALAKCSVLNSFVIDEIASKNKNIDPKGTKALPSFISKNLDIILTICNVRGIPFDLTFTTYKRTPSHQIVYHKGHFTYRLNASKKQHQRENHQTDKETDFYEIDLNNPKDIKSLLQIAKATSAYPVGLMPRKVKANKAFFDKFAKSIVPDIKNIELNNQLKEGEQYEFLAVDGGLINNEPFGIAYRNLQDKLIDTSKPTDQKNEHKKFGLIMIDPFPAKSMAKPILHDRSMLNMIPKLFSTLRNQVMFKQDDLFGALADDDYSRFLIAPSRKVNALDDDGNVILDENGKAKKLKVEHPLACGALEGFSGFFDQKFREHDYKLGRKNCQDFLHYYFAIQAKDNHPIHQNWTPEMKKRFGFVKEKIGKNGKEDVVFYPIIPDMNTTNAKADQHKNKEPDDIDNAFPSFDKKTLPSIKKLLQKRLQFIAENIYDFNAFLKQDQSGNRIVKTYKTIARKVKIMVLRKLIIPETIGIISNSAIDRIEEDFKEKGLIIVKEDVK